MSHKPARNINIKNTDRLESIIIPFRIMVKCQMWNTQLKGNLYFHVFKYPALGFFFRLGGIPKSSNHDLNWILLALILFLNLKFMSTHLKDFTNNMEMVLSVVLYDFK